MGQRLEPMWNRQVRQQETVSRAGILQICFMLERSRMDGYWYWWYHGHTKVIAATAPFQNLLVPSQSLWSRPREGENSKPFWWKPPFVVYDWWGYVGFATMGKTLRCFHSSSVQHCTSSHCLVPLAAQPWVSPAVSKENCSFTMIKGRFNIVKISILTISCLCQKFHQNHPVAILRNLMQFARHLPVFSI